MSNLNIPAISDSELSFDFSKVEFDKTIPSSETIILSTMCANAVVVGIDGDQIRIVAHGGKSKDLEVKVSGPDTMLTAPLEYSSASAMSANLFGGGISINVSGTSMINGVLHIDGRAVDTSNPMQLMVMVPKGTTVKVGMVIGEKVLVRDVNGALEAKVSGSTKLDVDSVTTADIKIVGSGDFHCGSIKGKKLAVKVTGMGSAHIRSGDVQVFEGKVTGMGNIVYNGAAVDADLSVSGMGNITLLTCAGQLQKSKTGMGNITVVNKSSAPKTSGFESW